MAALRASKDQLEIILQGVADGITVQDRSGALVYANPSAARMIGYPDPEALLAAPPAELIQRFEFRDEAGQIIPLSVLPGRRALQGEYPPPLTMRFIHLETGEQRWSRVGATPIFTEEGEVSHAINVFHDVTERTYAAQRLAESERRYRSLFYDNPDGVFYVDVEGRFVSVNMALERLSGYRMEELVDHSFVPLIVPADLPRAMDAFHQLLQGHPNSMEIGLLHKAGHRVEIYVTSIPVMVEGKTTGVFGVAKDITARKQAEAERDRLFQETQEAVRLREMVLSIASHELRSPLTTILGYAQLLQRKGLHQEEVGSPRVQRALQVISEQTDRLNKLIGTLMDFSHLQTGRLTIERSRLDLAELLRSHVEQNKPLRQRHALEVYLPEAPLWIKGNALRLEQVLQNLIDNAIKYSPHGGTIQLHLAQEGAQARLTVSDRGIGIPANSLPHLFDSFYRADNVEQVSVEGLGLGLYLVKQTITLHDGTISVQSEEGLGSTFTIHLPLVQESAE